MQGAMLFTQHHSLRINSNKEPVSFNETGSFNLLKMKKNLMFFLLVAPFISQGQYIHYNNVYMYLPDTASCLLANTIMYDDHYISYGSAIVVEDGFYRQRWVARTTDFEGNTLNLKHESLPVVYETPGINGQFSCLRLSDGGIIQMNLHLPCNSYQTTIQLNKWMGDEIIWDHSYEELIGDCELENELYEMTACEINDSTFVVISRYIEAENQFGLAFTYFDFDGNIQNHYYYTESVGLWKTNLTHVYDMDTYLLCTGTTYNGNDQQNMIAKYDYEGNMLDSVQFGSSEFQDVGHSSLLLQNGNIFIAYNELLSWDIFNNYCITAQPHYMMYDSDLSLIYDIIPDEYPYQDLLMTGAGHRQAISTIDNKIVLVGNYSSSCLGEVVNYVTKLNMNGITEWLYEYQPSIMSTDERLETIIETNDSGYLISGNTYAPTQKFWLLKIDACGYEDENGCPPVVGVEEGNSHSELVELWPNPFTSTLKAVLTQNAERVFITDTTGRIVFEENVFYPNQTWNLSALSDGVYVLSVELESGQVISERIVKQ